MTKAKGAKRRPAKRPPPRTVEVAIAEGAFEGWWALCRADFPGTLLEDLESGDLKLVLAAMGQIIVEHNFPNAKGELAARLAEVDPYDGMTTVLAEFFKLRRSLPNR